MGADSGDTSVSEVSAVIGAGASEICPEIFTGQSGRKLEVKFVDAFVAL